MHNKKINNSKSRNFIQGLRPLSSSLPHGLKKIIKKKGYNFSNIVDNWTKMVGNKIADACYPKSVRVGKELSNGILILNVIHGKELDIEYSKQEIKDKINSFYGYNYIEKIQLKIIQDKKVSINNLSLQKISFDKKLSNIKDGKLKSSLNKLLKAFNEKNI